MDFSDNRVILVKKTRWKKFLLFRAFCNPRKYKNRIAKFDYPAIYIIDYNALISFPSIKIIPSKEAEDIKKLLYLN